MSGESEDSDMKNETEHKKIAPPPKKRVKKTTKASKDSKENTGTEKKKRKRASTVSSNDSPRIRDIIIEAIECLDEQYGSSVSALKSFISSHYSYISATGDARFKSLLKRALTSLVNEDIIKRPKGQEEIKGVLVGRWTLAPPKAEELAAKKERPASLRQRNVLDKINKGIQPKSATEKKKKKKRRKSGY